LAYLVHVFPVSTDDEAGGTCEGVCTEEAEGTREGVHTEEAGGTLEESALRRKLKEHVEELTMRILVTGV
jgi:hypothetical protein